MQRAIHYFAEFKKNLILRFHEVERGSSYEMLMSLKQDESVGEYIENFGALLAPLQEASEKLMGLAWKLEARNKLAEKNREDFLI